LTIGHTKRGLSADPLDVAPGLRSAEVQMIIIEASRGLGRQSIKASAPHRRKLTHGAADMLKMPSAGGQFRSRRGGGAPLLA